MAILDALQRRELVAEVRPSAIQPPAFQLVAERSPGERGSAGRDDARRTVTLRDRQPFTKGPYFAWIAPWGAGALREGADYTETLTLRPDRFPADTAMRWSWPARAPAQFGVYNFAAIDFGDDYGTAVERPIPPRTVSAIDTLTATRDLAIGGAPDGYDVLIDYFLTKEAGKHDVHLFEIEVFFHTPPYSKDYVRAADQLGTYTDAGGRAWTVAVNPKNGHGPALLFMPADGADVLSGTVDLQAMHRWLIAHGAITGREWFNGLGIGAEVRQGAGSLTVRRFSVDYR